ncbi:hypothetical protein LIER_11706 [Lithospermum erythrorhizon]|uniref:Uncharacterized protein n=1 Tax=Lithospermum erythrorhizon TaxID=34254 RepID=A0AAV3PQG2_LITER
MLDDKKGKGMEENMKIFKEVASVSRGDEDFSKVLKDPQYERIREALYSDSTPLNKVEADEINQVGGYTEIQDRKAKDDEDIEQGIHNDDLSSKPNNEDTRKTTSDQCGMLGKQLPENDYHVRVKEVVHSDSQLRPLQRTLHTKKEPHCEIEEIGEQNAEESKHLIRVQNNQRLEKFDTSEKKNVSIRPEVEKALNILDMAIKVIRENKSNIEQSNVPNITSEKPNIEEEENPKELSPSKGEKILQTGVVSTKLSRKECREISNEHRNNSFSHSSRRSGSSSYAREANQSKVSPASPDQLINNTGETQHVSINSSVSQTMGPSPEKTTLEYNTSNTTIDLINGESKIKKKSKKLRLCCLHFIY